MTQEYAMTQRRVENIVRCLTVLEAEIQDSAFDCASCQAQPAVVDLVGWCRELLAERLALLQENERLRKELNGATECPRCNGSGKAWFSLWGTGRCDQCDGSGRR